MEKAIEQQCEFIAKLKDMEPFQSQEEFEREVVARLNSISSSWGLEQRYFSHNGFVNKYCSLLCSGCEHRAYVWFTYKTTSSGAPTDITFVRNPYGRGMHTDVDRHIRTQLPPLP